MQKVADPNPVRPTTQFLWKTILRINHERYGCGLAMSGIESSKEPKQPQVHVCKSCVETVVQTFTHYHEQVAQLKLEKDGLQKELRKLIDAHEEQKLVMVKEIKALEERLTLLKERSETHI